MHACRRKRSDGGRFVTKPDDPAHGSIMVNSPSNIELANQGRTEG